MRSHGARQIILRMLVVLLVTSILFSPRFALPVYAQTGSIRFENISTEQGLSQSTVHKIVQDQQGFMWIATEGGLNQYDGYQFTVSQHDPDNPRSLSANLIFTFFEDQDGILWIGTENGGLNRFDQASGIFIHYQHNANDPMSLSDNGVRTIFEDHSGSLRIGTEQGGLNLWDNQDNHFKIYRHEPGNPSSLTQDRLPGGQFMPC